MYSYIYIYTQVKHTSHVWPVYMNILAMLPPQVDPGQISSCTNAGSCQELKNNAHDQLMKAVAQLGKLPITKCVSQSPDMQAMRTVSSLRKISLQAVSDACSAYPHSKQNDSEELGQESELPQQAARSFERLYKGTHTCFTKACHANPKPGK